MHLDTRQFSRRNHRGHIERFFIGMPNFGVFWVVLENSVILMYEM